MLLPILGGYAGGALLLFLAVRGSARAARWAGLGVAFIDVPMVFFAQWVSLPVSPSPGGVAGFSLGIFVLLVLLGGLSLDVRQMLLVALTAAVCEVLLQREAGIRGGAWAASIVVIGCAAAAAAHLIGRVRALVAGVATEQRKRERLGRYFSPAVAERLQTRARPERRARRAGADRAVLGHPRLHHDVRRAAARRGGAPAQRVLRAHGREDLPARRHARQVHRRRDHGLLRRAAARRRSRRPRARLRAGDARRAGAPQQRARRARRGPAAHRHRPAHRRRGRRRHRLARAPARLHRDRRHGQRRLAHRRADQGGRHAGAGVGGDARSRRRALHVEGVPADERARQERAAGAVRPRLCAAHEGRG